MNEAAYEYPDLVPYDPDRDAAYTILELQQTQLSNTRPFDDGVGQLELPHQCYNEEASASLIQGPPPSGSQEGLPSLDALLGPATHLSQEPFFADTYPVGPARYPSDSERVLTPTEPFRCAFPTCSSTSFSRRADLDRHLKTCHSENEMPSFPCPYPDCTRVKEFGFKREDKLNHHLRSVHKVVIPKKNLTFDAVSQLEENTSVVQSSTVRSYVEGLYTPGDRLSQFPGRVSSRRHALRRSEFACSHPNCSKTFNRACDLNRHLKTHQSQDARPHRCDICGQGFLYPKDRLRHEKTHGDKSELRYRCSVEQCSRNKLSEAFTLRDDLKRHIEVIHPGTDAHAITSSVMLSCFYCDIEFSRRDNLLRHLRKSHSGLADHSLTHAAELKPVEESNE